MEESKIRELVLQDVQHILKEQIDQPSRMILARQFAEDELAEIIEAFKTLDKRFENSEVYKVYGQSYVKSILAEYPNFAKILEKDYTKEEFSKLTHLQRSAVKNQQEKRYKLFRNIALAYNLIKEEEENA